MKFVVFEDCVSGNVWIAPVEKEEDLLKEMKEAGVTQWDRHEANPKNDVLLIELETKMRVIA